LMEEGWELGREAGCGVPRTCLSFRASRRSHGTGYDFCSAVPRGEGPWPEAFLDISSQQCTTSVHHCFWIFCAADAATGDVAAFLRQCGCLRRRHPEPQRVPGTLPTSPCATIRGDRRTGTKALCVARGCVRAVALAARSHRLQNWLMTRCVVLKGTAGEHLRQELAAVDDFLPLFIVRQPVLRHRQVGRVHRAASFHEAVGPGLCVV